MFHIYFRWYFLFLLLALLSVGCARPASDATSQASVKPSLQALEIIVRLLRDSEPPIDVDVTQPVYVKIADRISIEQEGRGLLIFPDQLIVELLRGTEVRIADVRLNAGASFFIRLNQTFGCTRIELQDAARTRIALETDYATVTGLRNAEFAICHSPRLTCLVAIQGPVEANAQGQVVTLESGEATYVLPGAPPKRPICANITAVRGWLDQKRGSEPAGDLGALVRGWPEQPCQQ